jgi:hypothetical protein
VGGWVQEEWWLQLPRFHVSLLYGPPFLTSVALLPPVVHLLLCVCVFSLVHYYEQDLSTYEEHKSTFALTKQQEAANRSTHTHTERRGGLTG